MQENVTTRRTPRRSFSHTLPSSLSSPSRSVFLFRLLTKQKFAKLNNLHFTGPRDCRRRSRVNPLSEHLVYSCLVSPIHSHHFCAHHASCYNAMQLPPTIICHVMPSNQNHARVCVVRGNHICVLAAELQYTDECPVYVSGKVSVFSNSFQPQHQFGVGIY